MLADANPFVYSRPVAPEDVIDRERETEELLGLAVGGHYVRLYAPRKFGKTSLLGKVLRDGEREGLVPVLVDLYGVLSIADVTVRIERAYAAQLKGSLRSRIDTFLKSTGLGLSLGAFGVSATLHTEPKSDPLPALHALLVAPLLVGMLAERRRRELWGFLVVAGVTVASLTWMYWIHDSPRYFCMLLPLAAVVAVEGVDAVLDRIVAQLPIPV